jgi:hypothetical protein
MIINILGRSFQNKHFLTNHIQLNELSTSNKSSPTTPQQHLAHQPAIYHANLLPFCSDWLLVIIIINCLLAYWCHQCLDEAEQKEVAKCPLRQWGGVFLNTYLIHI